MTSKMNILLQCSEALTSSSTNIDQPTHRSRHRYLDNNGNNGHTSRGRQQLAEIPVQHRGCMRSATENHLHSLLTPHPVGYDVSTGQTSRQQLLACVGSKAPCSSITTDRLHLERASQGPVSSQAAPHLFLGLQANNINSSNNFSNIYSSSSSSNIATMASFHRPDVAPNSN